MGNICDSEYKKDYRRNSYYKVNLDDKFILIINVTEKETIVNSFLSVPKNKIQEAKAFIKNKTCDEFSSLAGNSERENEKLKIETRESLLEIYKKSFFYKTEREEDINKIQLHYISVDQSSLDKYGMKLLSLDVFLYQYLNNVDIQKPKIFYDEDDSPFADLGKSKEEEIFKRNPIKHL